MSERPAMPGNPLQNARSMKHPFCRNLVLVLATDASQLAIKMQTLCRHLRQSSLALLSEQSDCIDRWQVIGDAGTKALSSVYVPALVAGFAEVSGDYQFMGDEHGTIRFTIRPTHHCDPTVILHDFLHVMRDDRVVDIWPIAARGY